jgi:hypothetical protein
MAKRKNKLAPAASYSTSPDPLVYSDEIRSTHAALRSAL